MYIHTRYRTSAGCFVSISGQNTHRIRDPGHRALCWQPEADKLNKGRIGCLVLTEITRCHLPEEVPLEEPKSKSLTLFEAVAKRGYQGVMLQPAERWKGGGRDECMNVLHLEKPSPFPNQSLSDLST
jgi:hypothetical protein